MVSFQNLCNLSSTNFKAAPRCNSIAFKGATSPLAPLEQDTFTKTGQPNIKTIKRNDGTIDYIEEQKGDEITTTTYQPDGKTVHSITSYNEKTKDTEEILYQKDGKTLYSVSKGNVYTGDTQTVHFRDDGKTVFDILEGNINTGNMKHIEYEPDGKTVKEVREDNFKK